MTWVEKYRPKSFEEIKGQFEVAEKIKNFMNAFPRKRAALLHGPPGTGKTTLAHVFAKETNSEIFELNASDLRNKNKLQEILKPAIEQRSLFKERKIILVDEVDGISAVDRGGIGELLNLIGSTKYPILITANDIWNKKFSDLRRKSELIQLKEIDYRTTKDILINILRNENKFLDNNILTKISINSKGDLRAAINDLQTESGVKDSGTSVNERNKEVDIFNALKLIFKGKPTNDSLRVFDSVNMSIDEIILWVEKNIPAEYQGEELEKAFDSLSKTDIFKRRIYKQQYWRFLVYENFFLSYGISAAKNLDRGPRSGFTSYKKPDRILKIWMNNKKNEKKKTIAQKYARYVHIGEKRAMNEFIVVKEFLKKPSIQKELRLTEGEIEYLTKV